MLKKSVPPFVAQMREMAELFVAEQPELDRMESDLSQLLSQFYIKTADYSLDRWEECLCVGTCDDMACVIYYITGTRTRKTGWVKWLGGIQD